MTTDTLRLAAAGEFEYYLSPVGSNSQLAHERSGFVALEPDVETVSAGATERLVGEARHSARAILDTLRPSSDEEEARLVRWKTQVDNLTPTDAINVGVYGELSRPTLSAKKSTLHTPYSALLDLHGNVEWRFGPDILQVGWYDNPGVSEIRLSPGPLSEYRTRRERLHNTVAKIAARHGMLAYPGSEHINLSAYKGEEPVFGDPNQDIEPYQRATVGLSKLYDEGILYDPRLKPRMPESLRIQPWRDRSSIRVVPGRFELCMITDNPERQRTFLNLDPARGLHFLATGMRYGLEHATAEEAAAIKTIELVAASPGKGFERQRDHALLRTCGGLATSEIMSGFMTYGRPYKNIPLDMPGAPDLALNDGSMRALQRVMTLSDEGYFSVDAAGMKRFTEDLFGEEKSKWSTIPHQALNGVFERVKVRLARSVTHDSLAPWIPYASPEEQDGTMKKIVPVAKALPVADPDTYAALLQHFTE